VEDNNSSKTQCEANNKQNWGCSKIERKEQKGNRGSFNGEAECREGGCLRGKKVSMDLFGGDGKKDLKKAGIR